MAEVVCFMNAVQAHSGTILPSAWTRSRTFKTRLVPSCVKYLRLVSGLDARCENLLRAVFFILTLQKWPQIHPKRPPILQGNNSVYIYIFRKDVCGLNINTPSENKWKCVYWTTQIKLFSGMLWSLPNVKLGIMLKCLRREMFAAWQHRCKSIYVRTEQHSVKVNWTEWTKKGCQQIREIIWSHLPDTILGMESHPNIIKSK